MYFSSNFFALVLVLLLAGNYVFGWGLPTAVPPGGDLPAPLDMSSTSQTKTGNLTIDSLLKIGRYTSAPTGSTGSLYYDTTENEFKGYKTSGWDSLGGGGVDTWITTQTCSTDHALQSVGKESKVCINKVDYSDVAYDLSCEDCIGPTEITDSYILNTSDTMSGNLTVAGNVGIGTTSPGTKLDVRGGIKTEGFYQTRGLRVWTSSAITLTAGQEILLLYQTGLYHISYLQIVAVADYGPRARGVYEAFLDGYTGTSVTTKYDGITGSFEARVIPGDHKGGLYYTASNNQTLRLSVYEYSPAGQVNLASDYLITD